MISRKEFDLLGDIAKLLSAYGPETFETLAVSMKSPEFVQEFAEFLESTANISRSIAMPIGGNKRSETLRSIRQELDDLRIVEPDKHVLLTSFYQALQDKQTLPTLRDVEYFATNSGLTLEKSNRRPQAVARLIRSLMKLSEPEIMQHLDRVHANSRSDNALQGWSEIILDKVPDKHFQ